MSIDDYFFNGQNGDTIVEKLKILDNNSRKARELEATIRELKTLKPPEEVLYEECAIQRSNSVNSLFEGARLDLELEKLHFAICSLDISGLNEEQIMEKMNGILSSYIHLESLINKLKLRLFLEIVQYSEFVLKAKSMIEVREAKEIIDTLRLKINILSELKQEEELVEESSQDNNLFFLMTDMGNIILYDSLCQPSMPPAYRDRAIELLKLMKQGVFRRVKYMVNFPFFEVRVDDVRILFSKLSKRNYLIIDVFVKKDHYSRGYMEYLRNRANQYLRFKDYYLEHIEDLDFIYSHFKIYEDVLSLSKNQNEDIGGRQNG